MSPKPSLICYFGHHRCSSTWISTILRQFSAETGRIYRVVDNSSKFGRDLDRFINEQNVAVLSYTNACYKYVKDLKNFRGFHVVRDPRDMLVSAYFSHLYSHPTDGWSELPEHRETLKRVSKDEGIRLEMIFSKSVLEDMLTWNYSLPNVLEVHMEDLIRASYTNFLEIFGFLDVIDHDKPIYERLRYDIVALLNRIHSSRKYSVLMPFRFPRERLIAQHLLSMLYDKRFSRLSKGREPGEQDVRNHYRKGQPGDWKNHFSKQNIELFKEMYNPVLLKLGYETDSKW